MRNKTLLLILSAAVMASGALYAQEPAEDRATFRTVKLYNDANPAPVDVTISCNTGLPLEQTVELDPNDTSITSDPYVEFVITDFESGSLDCEITESVPTGYTVSYLSIINAVGFSSEESCVFENVEHGSTFSDDPANNFCIVQNLLNPSEVTVTKEWIDENPQFNPNNFAEATYFCENLPDFQAQGAVQALGVSIPLPATEGGVIGDPESGNLTFIGNPGVDSFETFGNWDGGTVCSVTEQLVDSGVETDSSDCDSIVLFPGDSGACTIVNTRLFEGIPTLSQYGLGLLALLMLGMGFVAFRRIV